MAQAKTMSPPKELTPPAVEAVLLQVTKGVDEKTQVDPMLQLNEIILGMLDGDDVRPRFGLQLLAEHFRRAFILHLDSSHYPSKNDLVRLLAAIVEAYK